MINENTQHRTSLSQGEEKKEKKGKEQREREGLREPSINSFRPGTPGGDATFAVLPNNAAAGGVERGRAPCL